MSQTTDTLTGLMNRVSFYNTLKLIETKPEHVVMAIEMSRFGNLNNSMGSELGDMVISKVAKRLKTAFSNAYALGRTHGDHFVLFFEKLDNVQEEVARLLDFAQRPIIINGELIVLGLRVGVATGNDIKPDDLTKGLLSAAENALHRCKKTNLKVCYFDQSFGSEAKLVHRLENDLRVSMVKSFATNALDLHSAIINCEFELVYQPIIGTWDSDVHSFEALLRWNHPKHGEISPSTFIPIAEDISIMDILGGWVIRQACLDAMKWTANADGKLPSVSINVSPTQFVEPAILINSVRTTIKDTGIEPSRIHLEITESAAFSNTMKETLIELRSLGCKIALDDFGTGYSSLTQLYMLPLDYIKIDRSFIKNLCSNNPIAHKRCEKMTQGILALCDILSIVTIVEGVEKESQATRLKEIGANLLQGYYYSKPIKLSAVCDFIQKNSELT